MTTKTLTQKLIENKPYVIKSRCPGKYDFVNTHTFTKANPSYTIDMNTYNGLVSNYNTTTEVLSFSGTTLPWAFDYANTLNTANYALVNYNTEKSTYITEKSLNGTTSGSPTISSDFILSGYNSNQDYFVTPVIDYSLPFHMEMPISYTSLQGGWPYKSAVGQSLDTYFGYGNWIMAIGNGSNYHDMVINIATSTLNGKLVLDWDGSVYTYSIVTTSGTTYGPITYTSSTPIPNSVMYIGYSKNSTYSFDLKGFKFESQDSSKNVYAVIETVVPGETLPGCFYNYTDDGSAVTLNCFTYNKDQRIILTPDSSYSDEYLLGTVSLPAHTATISKTLTINTVPSDATGELVIAGVTYPNTKTYTTFGDNVSIYYAVTKEGYESQSNTITLNSDTTINVTLEEVDSYVDVQNYDYESDSSGNVILSSYSGTSDNIVVPTIQRS